MSGRAWNVVHVPLFRCLLFYLSQHTLTLYFSCSLFPQVHHSPHPSIQQLTYISISIQVVLLHHARAIFLVHQRSVSSSWKFQVRLKLLATLEFNLPIWLLSFEKAPSRLPSSSLSPSTSAGSSSLSFIYPPLPSSIMIHNFATFTALLKALQLTPGFSKPAPGSSYSFVNHSTPLLVEPASTPPAIVSTSLPVGHTLLDSRSAQGGSCYVQPYVASSIAVVFPPFDRDQATIMRYRQQQSVNMGSWYVRRFRSNPSLTQTLGLLTRIG